MFNKDIETRLLFLIVVTRYMNVYFQKWVIKKHLSDVEDWRCVLFHNYFFL